MIRTSIGRSSVFNAATALTMMVAAALAIVALAGVGHLAPIFAQGPSTPPATLRAYAHIFLAYAAVWLFLFLWVLRIASKLKNASVG